jgi:hypothetical protein
MAKARTRSRRKAAQGRGGKRIRIGFHHLLLGLVLFVPLMPSFVYLSAALAPSLVALAMDRSASRALPLSVGLLNLAGALPGLVEVWKGGHSLAAALEVIAAYQALLLAYGAAAVAAVIYHGLLPLVATHTHIATARRLRQIAHQQHELTETWGEELEGPPPKGS